MAMVCFYQPVQGLDKFIRPFHNNYSDSANKYFPQDRIDRFHSCRSNPERMPEWMVGAFEVIELKRVYITRSIHLYL
jgi:hypothetical protein